METTSSTSHPASHRSSQEWLFERIARYLLSGAAVLGTVVLHFWVASQPYPFWSWFACIAAILAVGALWLIYAWVLWLTFGWQYLDPLLRLKTHRQFACSAVLLAILFFTAWPAYVSFYFSRRALDQIADSVRAGQSIELPRRAGLFTIQKAERKDDAVLLWTEHHWGGGVGFQQLMPGGRHYGETKTYSGEWNGFWED
jgi:hypothetical protein